MTYITTRSKSGESGEYKLETFLVKQKKDKKGKLLEVGPTDVPPGRYYRLMRGKSCVMTNVPSECSKLMTFVSMARGAVLINGLGMGLMLEALLAKKEVTEITVVEKSKDILKLISSAFKNEKRVKFVNKDAFKYVVPKGKKYHCVWNHIWDFDIPDNLIEMTRLYKKYKGKAVYIESWCQRN